MERAARLRAGRWPAVAFDRDRDEQRVLVERCLDRLEQFRAPATRYAERAACYRAMVLLVSAVLWLRA